MPRRLFVSNLHFDIDARELEAAFMHYGKVVTARVIANKDDGSSRGFGFVEMATDAEASDALAADGITLEGRRIRVVFAREESRAGAPKGRGHGRSEE